MQGVQQGVDERRYPPQEGRDISLKRSREPVPKVRSSFYLAKCPDCGEERILFSNSAKDVGCRGCGRTLAESRGGKSVILASIVKKL